MASYTVSFDATLCITVEADDWEEAREKADEICSRIDELKASEAIASLAGHEDVELSLGLIFGVVNNDTGEEILR